MKTVLILFSMALDAVNPPAQLHAAAPEKAGVMRYRMATVNSNAWCDPRREADVSQEIDGSSRRASTAFPF